ncbi:MAG: endonuclease/exonuclease/phosphatase family protein, partial [Flavobacteriaceae bacterium]|nr:endonuclease/exonuclease/phosphatase family protein [Flavobacteriaceae bacterium]
MRFNIFVCLVLCLNLSFNLNAQDKRKFKAHTIAFYNVENLFDTINDPDKYDEASPIMEMKFDR